ncbi:hypothetical protein [Brachybacterium sp. YJGR34]|uniref:hypothetical protein n=1 Tax=Brachybacterium sp. YJGR34 TaxID=2059911 RepID=UPI00130077CC|nr:hypothetical protein [Brachybacterium sp. YJGR34]
MVHAQAPQGGGPRPGPGRAGRPLWHWLVLAGIALLGLLVVGVFAIVIAVQLLTRGDPESTLDDFYTSLESTDCALFMDSTTEQYREMTGLTSCEVFEENLGGISSVEYRVEERINRRGYAIFEVTETYSVDGEEVDVSLRYYVRRVDGQWDLDGIELVEDGAEPLT